MPEKQTTGKKDLLKEFIELIKDLIIIVIIVSLIRTFLVMPFQINGQSMYDSYYDLEYIIVDRFSHLDVPLINDKTVERGDVIVFKPHVNKDKEYFIKRIIGVPGDKLKIEGGIVYLYDNKDKEYKKLREGYLSELNHNSTFVGSDSRAHEFDIPEGSYFVMGDNRNASTDSRVCFQSCSIDGRTAYITHSDIVGKLWIDLGYFSFNKFTFLHPRYGIDTHPKWFSSISNYSYE